MVQENKIPDVENVQPLPKEEVERICQEYEAQVLKEVQAMREGDYVKVKSPFIIMECLGCRERMELRLVHIADLQRPPIDIEEHQRQLKAMEWKRLDGTPMQEGDVFPAICPDCLELGLDINSWGAGSQKIPIFEEED